MTHPTDDELEAMAVDMMFFQPGETSDQAAAMLRACKGRVMAKARNKIAAMIAAHEVQMLTDYEVSEDAWHGDVDRIDGHWQMADAILAALRVPDA